MSDNSLNEKKRPAIWPYLIMLALLAAQLASSLAWLDAVRYPFGAFHLSWSYGYAHTLQEQGLIAMLNKWGGETYYPPMTVSLWAVFHNVFGLSRNSVPFANTFCFLLCFLCLNSLARRATQTNWAGPLACALMLVAPHLAFYSRVPLYEVPMGAMLVIMVWGLLASERFSRPLPLVAAALAFAAGMLMKWTFVAYAIGPLLFTVSESFVYGYWRKRDGMGPFLTGRQILVGATGLILAGGLIAPWYLFALSWKEIAATAPADATPGGFADQALWYLKLMYKQNLSKPLTTALVVCLPWLAAGKRIREGASILAALLGAYLVFTLIPHKDHRYATTLIPLCALGIAVGLANAGRILGGVWEKCAALVGVGLVVLGAWNVYDMSFRKNILPLDSGHLAEKPIECLNDFDNTFAKLQNHLRDFPEDKVVTLAIHPFSPMTLSFHLDLAQYFVNLYNAQGSRSALAIGFENQDYEIFPKRYLEADLLLVTQGVWDMSREQMEKSLKDMTDFNNPGAAPPPLPENDPQYRELIEASFTEVESIPTQCAGVVHVYKKN